jgi:hypothetical protein
MGAKFRRLCRIENWGVGFYCFGPRLAIELDGGVHSQPSQMRNDASKEDYLRTVGICLLGIPNGWVLEDPEEFVRKVPEAMKMNPDQMTPDEQDTPLPSRPSADGLMKAPEQDTLSPKERAVQSYGARM